jgi:ribosomal subunit interface protein
MQVKITGKNIDVGVAMREHATAIVDEVLTKHFDRGYEGHIVFERTRIGFNVECVVHLDSGVRLQSHAEAPEARIALELAAEKLEKRLRRYRRRLKEHHPVRVENAFSVVLASPSEDDEEPAEGDGANPVVVAETTSPLPTLTVGEAVMRLDLGGQPFILFRSAAHGGLNVVYRRDDGHIGWLDPDRAAVADASSR